MNDAMSTDAWDAVMPRAWRTIQSAPAAGAHNMAVDAALLEAAPARDFGVWRTYAWERPTVSFGRNEAVRTQYDAASLRGVGLDAVRRPTGGRALLHAAEVTYSVTLPVAARLRWQDVYAAVNGVLVEALRSLGVPAEIAGALHAPLLRPDGPVCFAQPSPGEIVVHGQKLVGSAVWRDRGAYLQHGSILLDDQQGRLHDAMCAPSRTTSDPSAAATLGSILTMVPSWADVASALEAALRRAVSARHEGVLAPDAVPLDAHLVARHEVRFADPAWLWRR